MKWNETKVKLPVVGIKVLVLNDGLLNVASLEKEGWLLEFKSRELDSVCLENVTHWQLIQVPVERQLENDKSVEITYTFYLPEHQDDIEHFENGTRYFEVLNQINKECKYTWNNELQLKAGNKEKAFFAEKISNIINNL